VDRTRMATAARDRKVRELDFAAFLAASRHGRSAPAIHRCPSCS
jgi:hypothetical protein